MKLYIVIVFLIASVLSFSQENNPNLSVSIDSISISGNKITEDFIILRELTIRIGDTVEDQLLEYNKERIFSLGLFTKVDLSIKESDYKNILHIDVEESWYIYPVPFVQLQDRDWDKLSYGFILFIKNFRGRNETLSGAAAFGYDPSFSLAYYKPNIVERSDIYFGIETSYRTSSNRSLIAETIYGNNFDQKNIIGQLNFGNRFGNFHRAGIDIGYQYIETPFFIKGINASDSRIDRLVKLGLNYSYDTRDLMQYAKEGIFFNFYTQFKGLGMNGINYQVHNIDFREYRKIIGDLNAKWRIATRQVTGGLIPYYDFSFIGFQERIRGYFNEQSEGHRSYTSSIELSYPILRDINITFDFVPIVPQELLTYRLALYFHLFTDTGATQLRGKPIGIKDFNTGYGGGLTLLVLPYSIARLEFAINDNGLSEFILDVGVSF